MNDLPYKFPAPNKPLITIQTIRMIFQIKPISKEGIPVALEKAERYRLLNEPWLAESICHDILKADPNNTRAIIILILATTDQFGTVTSEEVGTAKRLLSRLPPYEQNYYEGIICERQGKSALNRAIPDSGHIAYEWFRDAMDHYEKAEAIRPQGNDDSILRWNTCVRLITRYQLEPRDETYIESQLE
jgi:hypothetical protein